MKIFMFEYPVKNLSLSSTILEESILVLLALCQLYNPLKILELDTFYPEYLNLSKNDENYWIVYADKVEEIMLKAKKDRLKSSNSGNKDVLKLIQILEAKNSNSKTEKED